MLFPNDRNYLGSWHTTLVKSDVVNTVNFLAVSPESRHFLGLTNENPCVFQRH